MNRDSEVHYWLSRQTDRQTRTHTDSSNTLPDGYSLKVELAICRPNFATRTRRRERNKLKAMKLGDGEEMQIEAVLVSATVGYGGEGIGRIAPP
jgi:hypothetical protein